MGRLECTAAFTAPLPKFRFGGFVYGYLETGDPYLLELARSQREVPVLGRTLMQPAQVVSLDFKLAGWIAVRAERGVAEDAVGQAIRDFGDGKRVPGEPGEAIDDIRADGAMCEEDARAADALKVLAQRHIVEHRGRAHSTTSSTPSPPRAGVRIAARTIPR